MSGSITATTLAYASLAMTAVGTVGSMIGQSQQASAQKAAANYNAEVAAGNAAIAKQNATLEAQTGEEQAAIKEQETRTKAGAMLASMGASGVTAGEGSSADVLSGISQTGQLDALTIRSNAARRAYNYDVEASGYTNTAALDTSTAANATTAGMIGAGATLLSGAGSAGMNYAKFMQGSGMTAPGSVDSMSGGTSL